MYSIYFGDKRKEIGTCSNEDELFKVINKFLKQHNFKSYYFRVNYLDNEVEIDVGSHSKFFYVDKNVFKR